MFIKHISLTNVVVTAFLGYICYSIYGIYSLFVPAPCLKKSLCFYPASHTEVNMKLSLFISRKSQFSESNAKLIYQNSSFDMYSTFETDISIEVSRSIVRNNRTLYLLFAVSPYSVADDKVLGSDLSVIIRDSLTQYEIPQAKSVNLIGSSIDDTVGPNTDVHDGKPTLHWKKYLNLHIMGDNLTLPQNEMPVELLPMVLLIRGTNRYLPIVFINNLVNDRISNLVSFNDSVEGNNSFITVNVTLRYSPISFGKLRLLKNIEQSINMMHQLGFQRKDTEEVVSIFTDTSLVLLLTTMLVSALHLVFDFLAFRNDIAYWRKRDSVAGLSMTGIVWRAVSTVIILLYLIDERASLLVTIPMGIGAVIELWKVKKALRVRFDWSAFRLRLEPSVDKDASLTTSFDQQALRYLSMLLVPLLVAGAIYSMLFVPHRSWYSWLINSLVNAVYAFGFLFMCPQLFINYKFKSVAHLPWRAFTYKAFNTVIDDLFAFIITMPTTHRLACFRDDVVFVIYLYQRWLYPVDKTRPNEFGQTFEEADADEKKRL